jgi:hypothetical protein
MIYFSSLLRYYKLLVAGQAADKVKLASAWARACAGPP